MRLNYETATRAPQKVRCMMRRRDSKTYDALMDLFVFHDTLDRRRFELSPKVYKTGERSTTSVMISAPRVELQRR